MRSASAPGSLMLFGEHAVLHGRQAMSCAINQRIRVSLTPRQDQAIHLSSSTLGNRIIDLNSLSIQAPFEFVLAAIDYFRSQITQGFNLSIQAEFSSTMGLGSSSAVTVATLGVLAQWLNLSLSKMDLFKAGKEVILRVQGVGSGADVAAAVFGGVVAYRTDPLAIESHAFAPDLVLVYSGAKVPTKTVIEWVTAKQQVEPNKYQDLFDKIDACAQQAVNALKKQDWSLLGELMNQHHYLQEQLGVSTPVLNELAADLRRQSRVFGAKISGSGMGDCVVALGQMEKNLFPLTESQRAIGVCQIPIMISTLGYSA